jgi:hypothetical protein
MRVAPSGARFSLGAIAAPGGAPISTTFGRLTIWRQVNLRESRPLYRKRNAARASLAESPTLVPSNGFTA